MPSLARTWPVGAVVLLAIVFAVATQWYAGAGVSAASCSVSGLLSADTTWSPSGCDPYIATASVVVPTGVTLTIAPGTTVKFDSLKGLLVQGTLIARGTADSPITFTSSKPSPAKGDWGSIHFTDSSTDATFDGGDAYGGGSIIQYALIEYAGSSFYGSIEIESSSPYIDHNTVRNNGQYGIKYSTEKRQTSLLRITNNLITGNADDGVNIWAGEHIVAAISSNDIIGNVGKGVSAYGQGLGNTLISGNTVTGNGGGIGAERGQVTNNVITGNTRSGGIMILCCTTIPGSSDTTVNNNDIFNNSMDAQGQVRTTDFYNDNSTRDPNIDAKNNYWGTTDANIIADHIWDFFDDSSRGLVDYIPLRTSSITQSPPPSPSPTATATPTATPSPTMTRTPTPSPTPTPTPSIPNLSINNIATKESVWPGDVLSYLIALDNTGPTSMSVALTDTIPAGTSYIEGTVAGGAVYSPTINSILWSGTVIPILSTLPSETVQFRVMVSPDISIGPIVNRVVVSSASATGSATARTPVWRRMSLPLLVKESSGW